MIVITNIMKQNGYHKLIVNEDNHIESIFTASVFRKYSEYSLFVVSYTIVNEHI
jgi:hypothetical protein